MSLPPRSPDQPVSVRQLGAALAALGLYQGTDTATEHATEAARLGGPGPYRTRPANALLGAVQVEAMLAGSDAAGHLAAAHHEQPASAGVADDAEKPVGFLRRQALRVSIPLRLVAQDLPTGPIPSAVAHTAEGLRQLPGVAGTGQVPDVETVTAHVTEIDAPASA